MTLSLWTYEDLARRWKAPHWDVKRRTKLQEEAMSKWLRRRCSLIGLKKLMGFGRRDDARFSPEEVLRAEQAAQPARRHRYGRRAA